MLGIYCRTSRETDFEKSTIIQQKTVGIKFAEQNNLEYDLYEDEGISGFKISDDEQDPFKNRPAFTILINDIKNGKIDKVWVWEHSRLSRNQYASAFIFNVFEKYKITLYENQKEFKLDDPQLKFMRQMLDAVAEYERQLIVSRTTRGLRKRIDEGKRSHQKLYGYKQDGKDEKGYSIWKPVESELNEYKYIFKRFMEGANLLKICFELYDMNKIDKSRYMRYSTNIGRVLRKYQYTGYQLTIEGYDIYKKFIKNEIESLHILLNRKYWVKSYNYPVELITIEDWVKVCEKLQIRSKQFNIVRKERLLRASKDIATGLMECGDCGTRYYYHDQRQGKNKSGEWRIYYSYYHLARIHGKVCKQRPRSFTLNDINEIFKLFYFYTKLVFDNKNELTKESQRNIKQIQLKIKERIEKYEKEIPVIEKRILKFSNILENSDDKDVIEVLSKQIKRNEEKMNDLNIELSKIKIEYEIQNQKFNQTLLEMTYYDVKEKINDWFKKLNIEEQRNELIRIIKTCKIFGHYLIIDTGKIVFLFDIHQHYVFDMKLLKNLDKDEIYKSHFVEMKNKKLAKTFNDKLIVNIDLEKNADIKLRINKYIKKNFNIVYNLNETKNFISFVSLRGLYTPDK
jgi:DNA invertase Pin-like site-specific DNA recombinase